MNRQWVRGSAARSWHVVRLTRSIEPRSLCGRRFPGGEIREELPAGKSCESCLRISARQDDR